jgi:hypothetical protein
LRTPVNFIDVVPGDVIPCFSFSGGCCGLWLQLEDSEDSLGQASWKLFLSPSLSASIAI